MTTTTSPAGFTTPSLVRRVSSMLYESFLLGAVLFITAFLFVGLTHYDGTGPLKPLFQAYVFLVIGAYFVGFWAYGGQTLAMKTWSIRLVDANLGRITRRQAVLRFLAAWLSLGLGGVGLLWALFDRDHQFLHDRLAGTRLIRG